MAISVQWETHGAVRTMAGRVGADELMASVLDMQNDTRFDGMRYLISDFSGAEAVCVSPAELDMLTTMTIGVAFSNPHIRVAVVSAQASVRQLVHQFARTSPYVTRLFAQLAQAREWIYEGDTSPIPLDIQLQAAVRSGSGQPMA